MNKNKILGILSIVVFIIGWILYSTVGLVFALIFEIIAILLAVISNKKERNIFANIALVGSSILIAIMIIILVTTGISSNTGNQALINKSKQIQENNIK